VAPRLLGYNEQMAIVLALLAAGANALAIVFQRLGVEESSGSGESVRALMASLVRRPIWFAGLALATVSFLLQAVALSIGDLSTVQPVMVTEILFLVFILGTWFHWRISWREWIGASGTAAGLGVFLALSSSAGGHDRPSSSDWLLLGIACIGSIILLIGFAQRGTRSWRAACFGCAAGVSFALTAACIKAVADQWNRGPFFLLSHFEAYGVALAGLAGLVISQHALDAGPIAASQSALLIVNPLSSIVMGVLLFGDRVQASGGRAYLEAGFLIVMFLSLFVLSHSPLIVAGGPDERLSTRHSPPGLHPGHASP
jgi:drug/metabolite transporter (DMT)-like permease